MKAIYDKWRNGSTLEQIQIIVLTEVRDELIPIKGLKESTTQYIQ